MPFRDAEPASPITRGVFASKNGLSPTRLGSDLRRFLLHAELTPSSARWDLSERLLSSSLPFQIYFIPYNSILLINDELIGTLNDVLPLDVTVGDKITIQTAMDYKDNTLPVNNVYFNSVLEFKPQNISKTYEIKNRLIGQAITNEDDAKLVVSEFKKEMHLE